MEQADFETSRWKLDALRALSLNALMECIKAMHRDVLRQRLMKYLQCKGRAKGQL